MGKKLNYFPIFFIFFILTMLESSYCQGIWRRPGCHKVGHTRKVSIPDCVEFHITTNACRGFCESWSIPSGMETLRVNPFQVITSVGQCCNIMETEDVDVKVMCLEGIRELTFKSAKTCSCYHCKKD
ncbi:glycoprotein hormone alpha-2 precursor, putative [Pediculus humanus corporis]|uniref:Glycoprotein hormone alpha-2, putative n=1 Tax=Pediculus humanus subsp. corporis TaxID=121224 RepID=C6SUP0_PEDHC|nr:glycoprotein hormone alpha-2 precursor, putative [Pediculus humanus corporis]EEB15080.1 glycoprotein hormone alpha-2 precursor, putative [Pediculus humanus corporis]CAR94695.1 TPA: putaive glycoprotein hormone-alpha2 [Pediculus humanus corporis]